ncbi:MAG: DUF4093 domain-containing protein [Clostridia bacterium]|nr:DUF4093 domain-containing protein [Clostridia bacterium]MBR3974799.1 DUF4093 domain-containing protein [Clostridia bacterium]
MFHTQRAVIVEGKYDKIRLSSILDALIITTDGFGIFNNKEKQTLIKRLAKEKGLLILTDSDAAGFKIRNLIKNIADEENVIHAYIPDIFGKEKRKTEYSKEGKLGVEGIDNSVLEEALRKSGFFNESECVKKQREITNADLYEAGLTGRENSAEKRRQLLLSLGLPQRLSGKNMLSILNTFMTYEEFREKCMENKAG